MGAVFKVRVRGFNVDRLNLGPVELEILRVAVESVWRESGDPLETLAAVADAYKGKYSYVEIEVSGLDKEPRRVILGSSPQYEGRRPLFPRPARLLRVGILREGVVRARGFDAVGYAELKVEEDVEWINVEKKVYVFEGYVEVDPDIVYVVLDTEYGRRWVRVYPRLILRRASQQPEQQAAQAPPGGFAEDEDNSREE